MFYLRLIIIQPIDASGNGIIFLFEPTFYEVLEGVQVLLRIILTVPLDSDVTVTLNTMDGLATGIIVIIAISIDCALNLALIIIYYCVHE